MSFVKQFLTETQAANLTRMFSVLLHPLSDGQGDNPEPQAKPLYWENPITGEILDLARLQINLPTAEAVKHNELFRDASGLLDLAPLQALSKLPELIQRLPDCFAINSAEGDMAEQISKLEESRLIRAQLADAITAIASQELKATCAALAKSLSGKNAADDFILMQLSQQPFAKNVSSEYLSRFVEFAASDTLPTCIRARAALVLMLNDGYGASVRTELNVITAPEGIDEGDDDHGEDRRAGEHQREIEVSVFDSSERRGAGLCGENLACLFIPGAESLPRELANDYFFSFDQVVLDNWDQGMPLLRKILLDKDPIALPTGFRTLTAMFHVPTNVHFIDYALSVRQRTMCAEEVAGLVRPFLSPGNKHRGEAARILGGLGKLAQAETHLILSLLRDPELEVRDEALKSAALIEEPLREIEAAIIKAWNDSLVVAKDSEKRFTDPAIQTAASTIAHRSPRLRSAIERSCEASPNLTYHFVQLLGHHARMTPETKALFKSLFEICWADANTRVFYRSCALYLAERGGDAVPILDDLNESMRVIADDPMAKSPSSQPSDLVRALTMNIYELRGQRSLMRL